MRRRPRQHIFTLGEWILFMQPSRPDQTNNLQPRACCCMASPRSLKWPGRIWCSIQFLSTAAASSSGQRVSAFQLFLKACRKSIPLAQPAIFDNSMTRRVDDRRCFFLSYSFLGAVPTHEHLLRTAPRVLGHLFGNLRLLDACKPKFLRRT